MATIGEVQATIPGTDPFSENQVLPIKVYFGVFFDGTGNNMVQRNAALRFKEQNNGNKDWETNVIREKSVDFEDGANQLVNNKNREYSNVAILHSHYQGLEETELKNAEKESLVYVYNIYVEGAGVEEITHDKDENPYLRKYVDNPLNAKGSGFGLGDTGVVALVSKAIHLVKVRLANYNPNIKPQQKSEDESNKKIELHFDVIGFSRGAACARLFAFMVATDCSRELPCEKEFKYYLPKTYFEGQHIKFLDDFKERYVDYLGIFDTVSSIGLSYDDNVTDYGLYSPSLDKVKHTFHLCALDEFRSHFAITDIGSNPPSTGLEVFIPGCHSDVGGGYLTDNFDFDIDTSGQKSFYMNSVLSTNGNETQLIRIGSLEKLGWYSNKNYKEETCTNFLEEGRKDVTHISFTRYVKDGYSNIPLEMMANRSTQIELDRTMFKDITKRYVVDTNDNFLKKIQQECDDKIKGLNNGRFFYYPGKNYSSDEYKQLRSSFLHWSATDALMQSIAHKPNYNGNIISRFMYHGTYGDNQQHYMTDYNLL